MLSLKNHQFCYPQPPFFIFYRGDLMATNEAISQIIETLAAALLQDENTLSSGEKALLAEVLQNVKDHSSTSPEIDEIVTGKVASAFKNVVVQRILGRIKGYLTDTTVGSSLISSSLLIDTPVTISSITGDVLLSSLTFWSTSARSAFSPLL